MFYFYLYMGCLFYEVFELEYEIYMKMIKC